MDFYQTEVKALKDKHQKRKIKTQLECIKGIWKNSLEILFIEDLNLQSQPQKPLKPLNWGVKHMRNFTVPPVVI